MNEIFLNNIKAMEKWYPAFAGDILDREGRESQLEIDAYESYDGYLIYKVKCHERQLFLNGKRNVNDSLEMWAERIGRIQDHSTIVLIGLGSALYLKKLIQISPKNVNIILYEPSLDIFLKTLHLVDLVQEIESRPIAFIIEEINEEGLQSVIEKLISVETLDFLKVEIHPNYQELFGEKVLDVMKKIGRRTESIIANVNTGMAFANVMAKNQFLNMQYVCDGYNTRTLTKVVPHDGTAILVAAGPSLNNDIEVLKRAKGKAFILAVDTAVKPLIKAGIYPDAYITIDAKKVASLVDIDEIRDTAVIAPVTANHDILKYQRGKKIFYNDGYILPFLAYSSMGKILPDVSCGGSVATSGFSLLYKMGFNEIVLVGQDLAYTNGKSHADGTFEEVMPQEETEGMIMVKGNYEEKVPTRFDFKIYIDWYGMYIKGAKEYRKKAHNQELRVINATSGGAYLEGTELVSLKEVVGGLGEDIFDYEAAIESMESDFTPEGREKVIEYLHNVPKEFKEIKQSAKKLSSAYKKILNICKSGVVDKDAYLKQLKRAKKLQKDCESKAMYQIVISSMPGADYILKSESLYMDQEDAVEEGKAIAKQGMLFCKMVEECAGILQEYANETLAQVI